MIRAVVGALAMALFWLQGVLILPVAFVYGTDEAVCLAVGVLLSGLCLMIVDPLE